MSAPTPVSPLDQNFYGVGACPPCATITPSAGICYALCEADRIGCQAFLELAETDIVDFDCAKYVEEICNVAARIGGRCSEAFRRQVLLNCQEGKQRLFDFLTNQCVKLFPGGPGLNPPPHSPPPRGRGGPPPDPPVPQQGVPVPIR